MTARAQAVLSGDRRALSRLLTLAEAGDPNIVDDLKALYRAGGSARVLGVTGPPGSGKSTLVDRLVSRLRAAGRSVAVLAIDPTSPITQGAILGDRVRMGRHAEDPGVLIRSMATRGELGGLAAAAGDAITLLDAAGFNEIIVETVGVGQSETDVVAHAETVLLLQTADGGDAVQTIKAGVLEIADLIAVNKADAPGTDKTVRDLEEMLANVSRPNGWTPQVVRTEATRDHGLDELIKALEAHRAALASDAAADHAARRRRLFARMRQIGDAAWRRSARHAEQAVTDEEIEAVLARRDDPYALTERVAARIVHQSFGRKAPRRAIIA